MGGAAEGGGWRDRGAWTRVCSITSPEVHTHPPCIFTDAFLEERARPRFFFSFFLPFKSGTQPTCETKVNHIQLLKIAYYSESKKRGYWKHDIATSCFGECSVGEIRMKPVEVENSVDEFNRRV